MGNLRIGPYLAFISMAAEPGASVRDVPLHLVEMTNNDLFIHKRKTSLGTRCSTLPGRLRCWCYERIMWHAAAPDMRK
jgi:hypothetical protein